MNVAVRTLSPSPAPVQAQPPPLPPPAPSTTQQGEGTRGSVEENAAAQVFSKLFSFLILLVVIVLGFRAFMFCGALVFESPIVTAIGWVLVAIVILGKLFGKKGQ